MNRKFWKDKRVLITGHEGFLGSWMVKTLNGSGAIITGVDIVKNRRGSILSFCEREKIKGVKGDIADFKSMKKIIDKHKPQIIFHLAAEAIVARANKSPLRTFKSNIQGTWNILEIARSNKSIQAIVMASSDKAYGSHKILPYTEEAALKGKHPYDVSKSCADLIGCTYAYTYGVPVATTRCGNIYGPGDYNFSRIVPDAIRCVLKGEKLLIRSDGKFTRDYVYVEDIVNGYILLAEKLKKLNLSGEAFNFSDEHPISVLELVGKIYKQANKIPSYQIQSRAKYEIKHQYLSSRKARKVLGWKPKYSLTMGLKNALDWYSSIF
ncbi:MAG: GDP-mannose 4,6-dehydratase [Candidatus Omnitrophica bacterium]|nr:GDP-mannose 4,6-dehydratase [Candidatus Omnitrophota bacterium]MBU1924545.1 GDP-mannose 4,6-dehydratase [Candidatus Omnitrophota bacterium]